MIHKVKFAAVLLLAFLISSAPLNLSAQKKSDTSKQIYVPVYSSIYHGNRDKVINLAVTLSLRNVDSTRNVTVNSVDYYNSSGILIRNYLASPVSLKPLETMNIIIKEDDTQGGNTASFIVRWESAGSVNDLFVEAVMIGTYPQGISFTSRGIPVKR